MKRIKATYFLFICLLSSIFAQGAMQYSARHYSAADGLSQNTVMSILEDSDGFMWFGTWDGLNRFDGHNFTVYKPALSGSQVTSNRVDYLYEDSAQYIWMKTNDGAFYRLNKHSEKILPTGVHDTRFAYQQRHLLLEQRAGVIWLAGGRQLVRIEEELEGRKVRDKVKRNDYTLSADASCLLCDAAGSVWVGTDAGVEHFSEAGQHHLMLSTSAEDNRITAGLAHGQAVCFGTAAGDIWMTNAGSTSFSRLHLHFGSPITFIKALNDRSLIIGTENSGFGVYDTRSSKYTIYDASSKAISSNHFISAYVDRKHQAWLINEQNGVICLRSDGSLRHYESEPDKNYRNLQNYNLIFSEDAAGNVYVNPYGGGFAMYSEEEDRLVSNFEGISNIIHSAYIDKRGNLWLGSYDTGVDCISAQPERFTLSDNRGDGDQSIEVRALLQLRNGEVLVASKDGIIRRFTTDMQLLGQQTLPGRVYCMIEKADGTVLYGTKGDGIFVVKNGMRQQLTHSEKNNSLSSNNIYDMVYGADSSLYIATYGGGINILRDGQFIHEGSLWPGYTTEFGSKVRQLCMADDTTLWAATTNGLVRVNTRSLEVSQTSYYDIRAIYRSDDGHMWLGSFGGGLVEVLNPHAENVLAEQNIRLYNSLSGLSSDIVLSIVGDDKGDLWMNDENGIAHFDASTRTFRHYNALEGKKKAVFSESKSILLHNGTLLFGYNFGTCHFAPENLSHTIEAPEIRFTELLVMNDRATAGGPINDNICYRPDVKLKHAQSVFTIEYSALEFSTPENVQYAYKLDGVDKDWTYVQNERRVTYSNLPAGDYVFRVKSTNGEGIWCDNEQTLNIHIAPSFWATPWAFMIYFLIIFIICYVGYSQFKTTNQLRQEVAVEQKVTEIKLRFFTNISHELRTPLTLITGPVETVLREEQLSQVARTQLEIVKSNAQRMLRLINQILDFRKIQNNKMQLRVQYADVSALAKATFGNFVREAADKHIDFQFESHMNNPMGWVDSEKVDTIIYNLLSNAFKFTPSGKSIKLLVSDNEEYLILEVSDTGIGIPKDKRSVLFQRFSSNNEINASQEKTGTGIGLNLVKELIDLQNGHIDVSSEVGMGTTFRVMLLRDKAHFGEEANVIFSDTNATTAPSEITAAVEEEDSESGKKAVLVVDDNHDMRVFLQSILAKDYSVVQASDGEEAFTIAKQQPFDIIITDLMMPNVDGLELTERLKTDIFTSHVPVILLTAKSGIESRLQALEYGADDYITKPFSPEYLLARIDNIIRQRQRLQELYRTKMMQPTTTESEKPKEKRLSPDEIFLQKLQQFMEDNMDNNDLSVEDLVKEMAIGRTCFFNKLKTLTGLSPVEYIRDTRIRRSAELLLDGRYNITEVAYMVGLNDSRYFAKCFKAAYGMTPSEYKKQHDKK